MRPTLVAAVVAIAMTPFGTVTADPSHAIDPEPADDALDWESLCDLHTKRCTPIPAEDWDDWGIAPTPATLLPPPGGSFLKGLLPNEYVQLLRQLEDEAEGVLELVAGLEDGLGDADAPNASVTVDVEASAGVDAFGTSLSANASAHAHVSTEDLTQGGDAPPHQPGQVPCSDPRGCPDLVVDPTRMLESVTMHRNFTADSCSVQEGSAGVGERVLLTFTFTTPNVGDGDLVVGGPGPHPEWFEWGDCHEHWHFREYADYRLWTPETYMQWRQAREEHPDAMAHEVLEEHPDLREGFVAGHKQGFCVVDIMPYVPRHLPQYTNCFHGQGISRGWADEYIFYLDGQWIDVTDVQPGFYILEAEVNAERLFQESDYTNNAAAVLVAVQHAAGAAPVPDPGLEPIDPNDPPDDALDDLPLPPWVP